MVDDPRFGPPCDAGSKLLAWLEGEASGRRFLVSLRFFPPADPLRPWGEVRLGRGSSGLSLRPDDGALGRSLAEHLRGVFEDGRLHHDLWVEARWGRLVPFPPEPSTPDSPRGPWPLAVLRVVDDDPGLDPCRPCLLD